MFKNKKSHGGLKLPGGASAGKLDKIQALVYWADEYQKRYKKDDEAAEVKFAGVGRPSAPVNELVCLGAVKAWQTLEQQAQKVQEALSKKKMSHIDIADFCYKKGALPEIKSLIGSLEQTGPYDAKVQWLIAKGFNEFYDLHHVKIKPENILPTQGGAGGLYNFFKFLRKNYPEGYVLLQRPYYTLYIQQENPLLVFDIIEEPKDSINSTLKTLEVAIQEAKKTGKKITAIVLTDVNNPTGEKITEEQWECLVEILKEEQCYIAIDEAYAELDFSGKPFLLEFIDKKMHWIEGSLFGEEQKAQKAIYEAFLQRLLIWRTGTKGVSGAGIRMAAMITFSEMLRKALTKEDAYMGSLPQTSQQAYAEAVGAFKPRAQDEKLNFLSEFYKFQVRHVEQRLRKMGAAMSDLYNNDNQVDGTFYVRMNLKPLIGLVVTDKEIEARLKEIGLNGTTLTTDEDIAYYLLVRKTKKEMISIMVTPLSYFGTDPTAGILRLTCSEGIDFLNQILNEIEAVLKMVGNQTHNASSPSIYDEKKIKIEKNLEKSCLPSEIIPEVKPDKFLSPHELFDYWAKFFWEECSKKSKEVVEIKKAYVLKNINNVSIENLENPFSGIVFESKEEEIEKKSELIEQIVKARASINYANPQGDKESVEIMAKALNRWYKVEIITPKNILFVSVDPLALFKNIFGENILPFDKLKKNSGAVKGNNERSAVLVCNPHGRIGKPLKNDEFYSELGIIAGYLKENANHFIILNEEYLERCLDEKMSLREKSFTKFLLVSKFKDRIILVRSSQSIFSPAKNPVFALITFNNNVMSALLKESINMHVHPPRPLQFAYANAMQEFISGMLKDEKYRKSNIQYIKNFCKFCLLEVAPRKIQRSASAAAIISQSNKGSDHIDHHLQVKSVNLVSKSTSFNSPDPAQSPQQKSVISLTGEPSALTFQFDFLKTKNENDHYQNKELKIRTKNRLTRSFS